MRQFTSSHFRSNMAQVLSVADAGEDVVIRRRGNRSYLLIAIADDSLTVTPELSRRIECARREMAEGTTRRFDSAEGMNSWLESL